MIRLLPIVGLFLFCLFIQDRRQADRDGPDGDAPTKIQREPLAGPALVRQEFLAGLAATPTLPFPANLPWAVVRQVAVRREQAIEHLIKEQPTVFLQMCLDRYDLEVQGYSCTLHKRERMFGKLKPLEIIEAHFREQPFSVFMNWKQGAGKAQRVLYVSGENHDKMLVRPAGLAGAFGIFTRDVNAPDARASGRYLIDNFGIKLGTVRTLRAMLKAKERGALHVKYEGIFQVPEAGDRLCYKLVRTPYEPVEDEGVFELTVYLDTENWLQVGSILKDPQGKLIAEYFFRDLRLNPKFKDKQFQRGAL